VRIGSIAVFGRHSYAVPDTGEVWAWGCDGDGASPLGHGEEMPCLPPSRLSRCGTSRWMR
jgi:alpha-tubulin suppressor-like RCC1 family protein